MVARPRPCGARLRSLIYQGAALLPWSTLSGATGLGPLSSDSFLLSVTHRKDGKQGDLLRLGEGRGSPGRDSRTPPRPEGLEREDPGRVRRRRVPQVRGGRARRLWRPAGSGIPFRRWRILVEKAVELCAPGSRPDLRPVLQGDAPCAVARGLYGGGDCAVLSREDRPHLPFRQGGTPQARGPVSDVLCNEEGRILQGGA